MPGHVVGYWSMFGISFSEEAPREYRDSANGNEDFFGEVIMGMIGRGVLPVADSGEPRFISAAHSRSLRGLIAGGQEVMALA